MEHFEIASKCIRVAEIMIEDSELETAINRLYIASENIAMKLLLNFKVDVPRRHDKISNAIENFYKNGALSKNYAEIMRDLYKKHLFVDYGKESNENIAININDAINLLNEVRSFYTEASSISLGKQNRGQ